MRVRITEPLSGSIDGIQLSRFVTGVTYDVGTTVGNYLLAMEVAVPAESDTSTVGLPFHDDTDVLFPGHAIAEAADRAPRRRRLPTRKKH